MMLARSVKLGKLCTGSAAVAATGCTKLARPVFSMAVVTPTPASTPAALAKASDALLIVFPFRTSFNIFDSLTF